MEQFILAGESSKHHTSITSSEILNLTQDVMRFCLSSSWLYGRVRDRMDFGARWPFFSFVFSISFSSMKT